MGSVRKLLDLIFVIFCMAWFIMSAYLIFGTAYKTVNTERYLGKGVYSASDTGSLNMVKKDNTISGEEVLGVLRNAVDYCDVSSKIHFTDETNILTYTYGFIPKTATPISTVIHLNYTHPRKYTTLQISPDTANQSFLFGHRFIVTSEQKGTTYIITIKRVS